MSRGHLSLAALAVCVCVAPALAAVNIDVFPSIAPNATSGSPNWAPYEANALYALKNGLSSYGTTGSPSYYSQMANASNIPAGSFIVTNFPSWLGSATPGTTYGPNYAGEYGTRVHFGLHIEGNGTKFAISDLSFRIRYDDANYTDLELWTASGYTYNSSYVGLSYGTDGIKGTGDDQWITSGAATQLVDELFSRGSSLGYQVLTSDDGATNQDKIDNWIATNFGGDPYTITGIYTLATTTGASNFSVNAPEPTSIGLLAVGLLALRRRRA